MNVTAGKMIVAAIVCLMVFFPTYSKIHKLRLKDDALAQKMACLEQQNKQLSEEIEMLRTDPVYIEEVAREKLKVARENEIVFRVVDGVEE